MSKVAFAYINPISPFSHCMQYGLHFSVLQKHTHTDTENEMKKIESEATWLNRSKISIKSVDYLMYILGFFWLHVNFKIGWDSSTHIHESNLSCI